MKLYHYARKENTIMKDGLLSFSKSKVVNVKDYRSRAEGLNTQKDVIRWMESCFEGRSRGIRFFSEPIKWHDKALYVLKSFVDKTVLFSIDLDKMDEDGLIDAIYVSPPLCDHPDYDGDPKFRWGCDEIGVWMDVTITNPEKYNLKYLSVDAILINVNGEHLETASVLLKNVSDTEITFTLDFYDVTLEELVEKNCSVEFFPAIVFND